LIAVVLDQLVHVMQDRRGLRSSPGPAATAAPSPPAG
jgi:hypothetical protein